MTLTFAVSPAGSGVILADGVDVTGRSVQYEQGRVLQIHLDPGDGLELENWNEGQWFDQDWNYTVEQDATITAYLN